MGRILLRVAAALALLHSALTFVAAVAIFHSLTAESLAFAQHGFAFAFLGGLNLAIWQAPVRSRVAQYFAHGSNLIFLAFYTLFAFQKPEPPHYAAVAILTILTIAGLSQSTATPRQA